MTIEETNMIKKYSHSWAWAIVAPIGILYLCYLYIFKKELDGSDVFITLLIALYFFLGLFSMKSVVINFAKKRIAIIPFLKIFAEISFRFDEIAKIDSGPQQQTIFLKNGQKYHFSAWGFKDLENFKNEVEKICYDTKIIVKAGNKKWLRYSRIYKGLSILATGIAIAMLITVFFVAEQDKKYVLLLFALFGGIGFPLFLETFFAKIAYDDEEICYYSPWRANKKVRWSDIIKIESSSSEQRWELTTRTKGKITFDVNAYLSGVSEFIHLLKNKSNPPAPK